MQLGLDGSLRIGGGWQIRRCLFMCPLIAPILRSKCVVVLVPTFPFTNVAGQFSTKVGCLQDRTARRTPIFGPRRSHRQNWSPYASSFRPQTISDENELLPYKWHRLMQCLPISGLRLIKLQLFIAGMSHSIFVNHSGSRLCIPDILRSGISFSCRVCGHTNKNTSPEQLIMHDHCWFQFQSRLSTQPSPKNNARNPSKYWEQTCTHWLVPYRTPGRKR